jgi:hypothetical protein
MSSDTAEYTNGWKHDEQYIMQPGSWMMPNYAKSFGCWCNTYACKGRGHGSHATKFPGIVSQFHSMSEVVARCVCNLNS